MDTSGAVVYSAPCGARCEKEDSFMKIIVDSGQMNYSAREIDLYLQFIRNNMDAITSLVLGLDGEWKGQAGEAYVGRIISIRTELERVETFMEEMARLLLQFSEDYERHEDELLTKINAI